MSIVKHNDGQSVELDTTKEVTEPTKHLPIQKTS